MSSGNRGSASLILFCMSSTNPSDRILMSAISEQISGSTICVHSTGSNASLEKIIASSCLKNMGLSTGVAAQPGICIGTDVRGVAAADSISGSNKRMIYFVLKEPGDVELAQSTFGEGDKTTLISKGTELPIDIIMYTDDNKKLTIENKSKFLDLIVENIMRSAITIDAAFLYKAALFINGCGITLRDNDREYAIEDLHRLDPLKIGEIVLKTIEDSREFIPRNPFVLNNFKIQLERLRNIGNVLSDVSQLVDVTDSRLARPLSRIADLFQDQHPAGTTPRPG